MPFSSNTNRCPYSLTQPICFDGLPTTSAYGFTSLVTTAPAPIYYPVPLHLQKAYQDPRYKEGDFPVTEDVCKRVLSLPMHTEIDDEQIAFITESVLEFVNK